MEGKERQGRREGERSGGGQRGGVQVTSDEETRRFAPAQIKGREDERKGERRGRVGVGPLF